MPMAQSYLKTIGAIGKTVKAKLLKNEAQKFNYCFKKKLIEESKLKKIIK